MSASDHTQKSDLIKKDNSLTSDKTTLVHNSGTNELLNTQAQTNLLKNSHRFHTCNNFTARESQICALLKCGLKRAQIAAECNISPHTFDSHVRHIKFKSNISSTHELLRILFANSH